MDEVPNGNGHGKAARSALRLSESALALVATSRKMTVEQLHAHLANLLLAAAESGDVASARELRALTLGPLLGLNRARDSKGIFKRIRKALSAGKLSLEDSARALKFVEVARSLEISDLDVRLRRLEVAGTIIRRSEDDA